MDFVNVCWECYVKYNLVEFSRTWDEFGPTDVC